MKESKITIANKTVKVDLPSKESVEQGSISPLAPKALLWHEDLQKLSLGYGSDVSKEYVDTADANLLADINQLKDDDVAFVFQVGVAPGGPIFVGGGEGGPIFVGGGELGGGFGGGIIVTPVPHYHIAKLSVSQTKYLVENFGGTVDIVSDEVEGHQHTVTLQFNTITHNFDVLNITSGGNTQHVAFLIGNGDVTKSYVDAADAAIISTIQSHTQQLAGVVRQVNYNAPNANGNVLIDVPALYNTTGQNTNGALTQSASTSLLAAKADDATVVHKTGNEIVYGVKNFQDAAVFGNDIYATGGKFYPAIIQFPDGTVQTTASGAGSGAGVFTSGAGADSIVPNTAYNNEATAAASLIGGGAFNKALGASSAVVAGLYNRATYQSAAVVAGNNNVANGASSIVGAGTVNTNSGGISIIGAGSYNRIEASAQYSIIGSGNGNVINAGSNGAIVGGYQNNMSGGSSFIGGGEFNTVNTGWSFLGGGTHNSTGGGVNWAAVVCGNYNQANGNYSFVSNGVSNAANGEYSHILGGSGNSVDGFNCHIYGSTDTTIGSGCSNVVFINCDGLSIDNESDTTYINNQLYVPGGGVAQSYVDNADTNLQGQITTNNNNVGVLSSLLTNTKSTVVDAVNEVNYIAKNNSTTLNLIRGSGNNYSGTNSLVLGGEFNSISNKADCFIGGGYSNTINANYSAIFGGIYNQINSICSVAGGQNARCNGDTSIAFGYRVQANGFRSLAMGGDTNIVAGTNSAIVGGNFNTLNANFSSINNSTGCTVAAGCDYTTLIGCSNLTVTSGTNQTYINNKLVSNAGGLVSKSEDGTLWQIKVNDSGNVYGEAI